VAVAAAKTNPCLTLRSERCTMLRISLEKEEVDIRLTGGVELTATVAEKLLMAMGKIKI
jgi:hypothetical protein